MSNISNKILDAVGILVDKAVASAGYDKTIKATIVNVVDQARGEYRVKYQNGIFSAYTSSPDITYADGAVVYVTIPQNDTSKEKIITGAVKNKGINPVIDTTVDLEYSIIGENCIDAHEEFGLRSHLNEDRIICYDYNDSSNNKIMLNIDAVNEYIKTRGYLMCGITVRTSLPEYQKMRGDYGMKLTLAFVNSSSNSELINREYIFDDESMVGDPYNFISSTRQLKVFEIDNDNFSHVVGIELFAKNFPTQDDTKPADIFINNLEMYAAEVNSTSAEAFSLVINTPDGDTFTEVSANGTKRLRAQAKKQGMNITEDIPYYWFIKDVTVTASSLKYDRRGGQGWACLNPYNIISDTVREYVGGTNEIKLNINNVPTKATEFKCVAVYENNNIIGTRVIKNSVSNIDVNIISSNGTQFYLNTGETTLTCNVTIDGDIQELDNATYSWAAIDHNGVFTALREDKSLDVRAVDIDIYKTYSCSVYYNGALLGTSDIKITNSLKADNSNFRLVIENGDAVFLYNEAGVAPNDLSVAVPITIKPLSFTLYDNFGNAIPSENIDTSASKWIMPTENTLLKPARDANGNDNMIEIGDIKYKNGLQFEYNIERLYDAYKNNNNITLEVQYQGNTFRTQTNFTFMKQGDPGTNGTDTYCKIVLNTNEELKSDYPTVLVKADNTWTVSPTPAAENQWFKVQLYRGSELLTETIETNSVATVVWSVLTNVDTVTNLEIEATSGKVMYYPEITEDNRSNIIKVAVTYTNSDGRILTCYDTIPVVSVILNNNSEINTNWENIYLKKNTGVKYIIYQSDGTNPTIVGSSYELRTPEKYRCMWRSYFEEGHHQTVQQSSNICELARRYVPTFFNGYRTDKYITCSLYNKTDTPFAVRAIVHIPIHFLLNKYELASLNGWDGNSIDINQEGQYILAPQIGAGHKDEDGNNQFTGVVMGDVYTHNGQEEKLETGLFGYKDGQRSIFLDAETGKAEFGIDGASKIILDPTDNTAVIRSGNYIAGNDGLEIDFSTPTIKYGNGNFSVDENGILNATDGIFTGVISAEEGDIANFNISQNGLEATIQQKIIKEGYIYTQDDITRIQKIILNMITPTAEDYMKLDVDGNGIFDVRDMLYIRRILENLDSSDSIFSGKIKINSNSLNSIINFEYDEDTINTGNRIATKIGASGLITGNGNFDTIETKSLKIYTDLNTNSAVDYNPIALDISPREDAIPINFQSNGFSQICLQSINSGRLEALKEIRLRQPYFYIKNILQPIVISGTIIFIANEYGSGTISLTRTDIENSLGVKIDLSKTIMIACNGAQEANSFTVSETFINTSKGTFGYTYKDVVGVGGHVQINWMIITTPVIS